MTDFHQVGKVLVLIGVLLLVIGCGFLLFGRVSWFGRLPGDILIEKKRFTLYFPITTCILISLLLSLFFWYWGRK